MAEHISFKRPDGKSAPGVYMAPAQADGAPGLVVIQEWWGVNDQIKSVGERMVGQGYRVLIPDLYRGKVALDAAEAQHSMSGLNFGDAATQDVRGAVQYLKAKSTRVGVIGFCMGGVLAVLAAMHVPETTAASSWYGIPPDNAGDPAAIKIPLQCHFGIQDGFFKIASADALEKKLKAGGVTHECYRYEAGHAFGNEEGANYNREAATLAWQRSLKFLDRYLKG